MVEIESNYNVDTEVDTDDYDYSQQVPHQTSIHEYVDFHKFPISIKMDYVKMLLGEMSENGVKHKTMGRVADVMVSVSDTELEAGEADFFLTAAAVVNRSINDPVKREDFQKTIATGNPVFAAYAHLNAA